MSDSQPPENGAPQAPPDNSAEIQDTTGIVAQPEPSPQPEATGFEELEPMIPPDGIIHDYCKWACAETDAPPIFHMGSILPLLAFELAKMGFKIDRGHHPEVPQWWSLLVMGPGVRKSTCIRLASKFVADALYGSNGFKHKHLLHFDGSVSGMLYQLSTEFRQPGETTDAVLFREEASSILRMSMDGGVENLCELYDGQTITRHLRHLQKAMGHGVQSGPPTGSVIPNPRVTFIAASTPAALRTVVTPLVLEGGLFSRLAIFTQPSKAANMRPKRVDTTNARTPALQAWDAWAAGVAGWGPQGVASIIQIPNHVQQLAIDSLFEPYREQMAEGTTAVFTRAYDRVFHLAAMYAISRFALQVDEDDMCRAITLIEQNTAQHLQLARELSAREPVVEIADRLLVLLCKFRAKHDADTWMYLSELLNRGGCSRTMTLLALEHLEASDLIECQHNVRQPNKGRGRPTSTYRVTATGLAKSAMQDSTSIYPVYRDNDDDGEEAASTRVN